MPPSPDCRARSCSCTNGPPIPELFRAGVQLKQVCQPIYINGRFLTQGVTGVQRYARETLMAMDRLLAARADASGLSELTILAPAGAQRPALQHIGYREVGRLAGHLWEQTELAWHARDGLLFTFGFTGPLLHRHQITDCP